MEKTIKIACDTKDSLKLDEIIAFQGDLKELAPADALKLRKQIIDTGFAFPIYIWKTKEGNRISHYCVGGHARLHVLKGLRDDDYSIPPIPVVNSSGFEYL